MKSKSISKLQALLEAKDYKQLNDFFKQFQNTLLENCNCAKKRKNDGTILKNCSCVF